MFKPLGKIKAWYTLMCADWRQTCSGQPFSSFGGWNSKTALANTELGRSGENYRLGKLNVFVDILSGWWRYQSNSSLLSIRHIWKTTQQPSTWSSRALWPVPGSWSSKNAIKQLSAVITAICFKFFYCILFCYATYLIFCLLSQRTEMSTGF